MTAKVDIVNLAALYLGQPAIESFDTDTSQIGAAARVSYEFERKAVLRGFAWNFALRRETISSTGNTPTYGYNYEYNWLSDWLRVVEVNGDDEESGNWASENRKILTDLGPDVDVKVVYDHQTPDNWDAMFIEAFARKLAWNWAETVLKSSSSMEEQRRAYAEVLRTARSVESKEKTPDEVVADKWIRSRGRVELRLAVTEGALALLADDPHPERAI